MTSQKQLLFACGLAVHLLVVGIVCYAVFSTKGSEEPVRFMYKTTAGKVLFDHAIHCNDMPGGYGTVCSDCHHHPSDVDDLVKNSCRTCHQNNDKSCCLSCHREEDVEDVEVISRTDAFHTQCVECHEQIETGPQKCSQCHVLY